MKRDVEASSGPLSYRTLQLHVDYPQVKTLDYETREESSQQEQNNASVETQSQGML
jgi:hypothetical protein